jgi:hypothetical protein
MSSNQIIISRHVIFDETAFPFVERDDPSTPATLEFLDASDTVLAPIGSPHKFLSAGPSSGASTCAPDASPRPSPMTSSPAPRAAPSPAPHAASPAPRVATPSSSPTPRAATAPTSSTKRYVPLGLRGGPSGLPPGSLPPEHVITKAYSRRPRSTTAPASAPAPAPLPTGTVTVPPRRQPAPHGDSGKARFSCSRPLHRHFPVSGPEDVPRGPCGSCLALRV